MSNAASRAQMLTDAANALKGQKLTQENAPEIIIELLEIGFRCGQEAKAGEVQPLITRLEGIEIDPAEITLCSLN